MEKYRNKGVARFIKQFREQMPDELQTIANNWWKQDRHLWQWE